MEAYTPHIAAVIAAVAVGAVVFALPAGSAAVAGPGLAVQHHLGVAFELASGHCCWLAAAV